MHIPLPKTEQAKLLSVSRQSLYYTKKKPTKDAQLQRLVRKVLAHHPAYGYRMVALELGLNKKCTQRIMQKYNLRPKIRAKQAVARPSRAERLAGEAPNRLKLCCPIQPNAIWAGDFTKIWFRGHPRNLATVIDLFTREIIAWQIGNSHTNSLILAVLEEAKRRRRTTPMIFHTDQGSEYTSFSSAQWLLAHDILPSWSSKGKPWQNGIQEAFYRTFKLEFGSPNQHASLPALQEAMGRYMRYYNTKRKHSALKMAPRQFYNTKKWCSTSN